MNSPADLDLSGVLATLEQRKHQLEKELRAKLLEMQSDHIGFDSNSPIDGGDAATLDDAESLHIAEAQRDATELQEIESALQRIAAGSYGTCADCGQYIGTQRLKARPSASHCAYCQRKLEHTSLSTHHHPGE